MIATLLRWNTTPDVEAQQQILACNGSLAWAQGVVQRRPFAQEADLFAASDAVWWNLPEAAWQEAFDSHPRIGERDAKAASSASLSWSTGEQSGVSGDRTVRSALAAANRIYEEQFGRIFLVCATGKSASEILSILQVRLRHDPETELREAAEQQRRITQLRLRKWLGLPSARCEDV